MIALNKSVLIPKKKGRILFNKPNIVSLRADIQELTHLKGYNKAKKFKITFETLAISSPTINIFLSDKSNLNKSKIFLFLIQFNKKEGCKVKFNSFKLQGLILALPKLLAKGKRILVL